MLKKEDSCWTICQDCNGQGKKNRRIRKKTRLDYQIALQEFEISKAQNSPPNPPKSQPYICEICKGSGLIKATNSTKVDAENFPHIAIIGAGIGGVALAVACLHRGIPFTLFERDAGFEVRSQGYGLTLQQASKAIEGFGIFKLQHGVVSNRHVVHDTDGKIIGEWGMKKWMSNDENHSPKRTNIHIARQALRLELLNQLGDHQTVKWDHQLVDLMKTNDEKIELSIQVGDEIKQIKADLVVGADGIRSSVRKLVLGEEIAPLRYLGCIVILGICPLEAIQNVDRTLLNSETVFQTANGNERIYVMPFDSNSVMWQLSFPMSEEDAKALSEKGTSALKKEASIRTQWHEPIPQIIAATLETRISGYPVYDREILKPENLKNFGPITLIGDAAHPMSPFKGQGANQALLDAISLARLITKSCRPNSNWRDLGIRKAVLTDFEAEMMERSSVKVQDSAAAAEFLHSEIVLQEANEPRGRSLKRAETANNQ